MLLSVFETLTSGHQRSMSAWKTHINGAAALIKVRGPEQLATAAGVRLFLQATASLMVSCLGAGLALPDHIMEMNTKVAQHTNRTDPLWRYFETMGLLTNFRAHIRCGFFSDPRQMLARALEIDKAALSICVDAESLYEYETVYTDSDPEIFLVGCYHVYQDYMAATIWNGMRTIRMMLQENIRDALLKLSSSRSSSLIDEQYAGQYQASTDVLYQLQSDIIASVPQHLGYAATTPIAKGISAHIFPWSNFNSRAVNPYHSLTSNPAAPPMIRAFGGYSLPWALYVVGDVDIATDRVRNWVIGTLQRIVWSMGIQQAMVLADKLKKEHGL